MARDDRVDDDAIRRDERFGRYSVKTFRRRLIPHRSAASSRKRCRTRPGTSSGISPPMRPRRAPTKSTTSDAATDRAEGICGADLAAPEPRRCGRSRTRTSCGGATAASWRRWTRTRRRRGRRQRRARRRRTTKARGPEGRGATSARRFGRFRLGRQETATRPKRLRQLGDVRTQAGATRGGVPGGGGGEAGGARARRASDDRPRSRRSWRKGWRGRKV